MCETPHSPSNPDRKSAGGKNKILGKAVQQFVGETSQNLSENTGETPNKYPALLKQNRSAVNRTADKNNTWQSTEEDCGGKQFCG